MKTAVLISLFVVFVSVSAFKIISGDWAISNLAETVKAGESFQVVLKSNPSTGFRWELKSKPIYCESSNVDNFGEFIEPSDGLSGSPGKQIFSFSAKSAGEDHVVFAYERPWTKEGSKILEVKVKVST